MTDQRTLLLGLYAGVAGVLLIAGFIYKEIRDFREKHKKPKQLAFDSTPNHKTDPVIMTR
jgi:hypothetical protein